MPCYALLSCSAGYIWLGLSASQQCFSLTPNQPAVLQPMAYKPNQPKRTGRYLGGLVNTPNIKERIFVNPRLRVMKHVLCVGGITF